MTDYEYKYLKRWKNDWIQMQILFGYPEMTEYEYEYYSAYQ